MQCVRNCDGDLHKRKLFNQPVLQTAQMFVGEMGCWLVIGLIALYGRFFGSSGSMAAEYQAVNSNQTTDVAPEEQEENEEYLGGGKRNILKGFGVALLALPAICDILGTTLMNAGLLLVAASIYQMTRGALVLFVGLFSVIFLRRQLFLFQWLALVGVVTGVAVVGLAGAVWPDEKINRVGESSNGREGLSDAAKAVVGVLLIAGAQIFTATQFVLEEFILENSSIEPIVVVGWEGLFGFIVTIAGMIVMHLIVGRTEAGQYGTFDIVEGWRQMTENSSIWITSILIMISIGYVFVQCKLRHDLTNISTVGASISLVCPLLARSALPPVRLSTPVERFSFGLYRLVSVGNPLRDFRLSVLPCSCMPHSFSMESFNHP